MKVFNKKAFTLIEIMIAVAIVGILATMALSRILTSSHSGDAVNAVNLLMLLRQEQLAYRIEKRQYSNDCDSLEVQIIVPKGFEDLQCNNPEKDEAPLVQITKSDDYTLAIKIDGSFECSGGQNCAQVKKVLPR